MPVKRYVRQTDKNRSYFFDDFGGVAYDNRTWTAGGTTGWSIARFSALGGQVRLTCAATVGSEAFLTQSTYRNYTVASGAEILWRTKIESDATYMAWNLGLQVSGTQYLFLRADTEYGSNWSAICKDASGQTVVDTGLAITPDVWVEAKIVAASGSVQFFINNSLVATLTTNIPTGALGAMAYFYRYAGGSGTRSTLIDYVEILGGRL